MHKHQLISFILLILLSCGLFTVTTKSLSADLAENSWNTKTPMNHARTSLGVTAVDGKIYAIGGYTADSIIVGINEQYNPETDTWTTTTSMPTPRGQFTIVAYQNKIYCIGGITSKSSNNIVVESVVCNIVEVYDTVTERWSTKSALPRNEANAKAIAVNEKIFLIWGEDMFVYDIATDLWITKQLPERCRIPSYVDPVLIDNKIMYIDAIQFDNISGEPSKIMIYNPKTDTWSKSIGDTFSGTQFGGAAMITSGVYSSQKIYAIGLTTIQVYDLKDNMWTHAISMSTGRTGFGATIVDDLIYVIGGVTRNDLMNGHYDWYTPGTITAINEQYVPIGYLNALPPVTTQSLVVAILGITIVTVTTGVVFYFKKEKSWNDKI